MSTRQIVEDLSLKASEDAWSAILRTAKLSDTTAPGTGADVMNLGMLMLIGLYIVRLNLTPGDWERVSNLVFAAADTTRQKMAAMESPQ